MKENANITTFDHIKTYNKTGEVQRLPLWLRNFSSSRSDYFVNIFIYIYGIGLSNSHWANCSRNELKYHYTNTFEIKEHVVNLHRVRGEISKENFPNVSPFICEAFIKLHFVGILEKLKTNDPTGKFTHDVNFIRQHLQVYFHFIFASALYFQRRWKDNELFRSDEREQGVPENIRSKSIFVKTL